MRYAKGKRALGACDRCGLVYLLNTLTYQVVDNLATKLRVCTDCYDEDNPQGFPQQWLKKTEAIAVRDPRPDASDRTAVIDYDGWPTIRGVEIDVWPPRDVQDWEQAEFVQNNLLGEDGAQLITGGGSDLIL